MFSDFSVYLLNEIFVCKSDVLIENKSNISFCHNNYYIMYIIVLRLKFINLVSDCIAYKTIYSTFGYYLEVYYKQLLINIYYGRELIKRNSYRE